MFCTNCGNEMQNGSNFCGSCGKLVNVENNKMGTITFHRIGRIYRCILPMTVYIDGKYAGRLNNNDTFTANVEIGTHKVLIELSLNGITIEQITVTEDKPNVFVDLKLEGAFIARPEIVNIRS